MKHPLFNRITLPVALLAMGAFCPNLHAGWSSIQGNNRSAPAQPAPRPQPQPPMVRQAPPPVVRPAPQPQIHAPEPVVRPEPPRQETQPVVRVQPQIGAPRQPVVSVDQARVGEADQRRMNIGADRRQSFFWSDYHSGMRVDRLPDGYRHFRIRDHDYFYFEGVFYDDESSGYVVIAPPVDADVPDLPPGTETVVANGTVYYYAAGAFYVQQPDGSYVVVAPPIGVTVSELPPDAVETVVNGVVYYLADGTYYLPVMQDGVTVFLTVAQP